MPADSPVSLPLLPSLRFAWPPFLLPSFLAMAVAGCRAQDPGPPLPLHVAFVGDLESERGADHVRFLRITFGSVAAIERAQCTPEQLRTAHVVVLDWPPTPASAARPNPLGGFERWDRPTVLLGTATRTVAERWSLPGAAGSPLGAGLAARDPQHPALLHPHRLGAEALRQIGAGQENGPGGWGVDARTLNGPEIEVLCTGLGPDRAAAVWRQGHLLHWGPQQSPGQCGDAGRQLLENAIRYAARFVVDRPVVRAGAAPGWRLQALLDDPATTAEQLANAFAPPWRERIAAQGEAARAFVAERLPVLTAEDDRFTFDEDALAFGVDLRDGASLRTLAGHLRGERRAPALRLLLRLVGEVPGAPDAATTPNNWGHWLDANAAFLAHDPHCHRFRLDGLAHWRRVPSADVRGPARADGDAVREPAVTGLAQRVVARHGGARALRDLETFSCRSGDYSWFVDRRHGLARIENHGTLPPGALATPWQVMVYDLAADADLIRGGGPPPRPFVSGVGMYRRLIEHLFLPLLLLEPGTSLRALPDADGLARLEVRLAGPGLRPQATHVLHVERATGALIRIETPGRREAVFHHVERLGAIGPLELPVRLRREARRNAQTYDYEHVRWNPTAPADLATARERILR